MTPVGPNEYRSSAPSDAGGGHAGGGRAGEGVCDGTEELSCADVIHFLDDYVAGNLAMERRAAFEAHLAICPQCVEYIASYRRTIELVRDAAAPNAADPLPASPPSPLPPELVRLIMAARRR